MYYMELTLLALAAIVIIRGYKKNHRNTMLGGVFLLLISGWGIQGASDFADGFRDAENKYVQAAGK
jgi:hypothetical protein